YVCSPGGAHQVLRYNGTTGAFIDAFIPTGSGGLGLPWSLVFLPPQAPAGLVASFMGGTQINLDWVDRSDDETGFLVQRKGNGSSVPLASVGPNVTSYNDTGLQSDTLYTYKVRAYTSYSVSADWSNEAAVWTPAMPPPPVTALSAVAVSSTQINLTWALMSS